MISSDSFLYPAVCIIYMICCYSFASIIFGFLELQAVVCLQLLYHFKWYSLVVVLKMCWLFFRSTECVLQRLVTCLHQLSLDVHALKPIVFNFLQHSWRYSVVVSSLQKLKGQYFFLSGVNESCNVYFRICMFLSSVLILASRFKLTVHT